MDGAAILLLVSGVGVAFGWQPMPDGSPRYEYVVQVEPELAATLADGKSIPIVADVPPEAQPVGRIRIVVGGQAPPRQRLVTLLKPATADSAAPAPAAKSSQVELAQYTNPYARYAADPAQQQPPASSWNSQEPDPSITPTAETPPSGQQLFGQQGAGAVWNPDAAVDSVAGAAKDALSRVGNELQQSADPLIQQGMQRIDSEVRGAADTLGDRTRNLVDKMRASAPSAAAAQQGAAAQRPWNEDPPPTTGGNPLRTESPAAETWNDPPASAPTAASPAPARPPAPTGGPLAAPPFAAGQSAAPEATRDVDWNSGAGPATPDRSSATAPSKPGDPWANVPDPRSYPGVADNQNGAPRDAAAGAATQPLPFGGLGAGATASTPQFPQLGSPANAQPTATGPASANPQTGVANPPPASVDSRLLNRPADRPLDGAAAAAGSPIPTPTGATGSPTTPTWPALAQRPAPNAATTAPSATPITAPTTPQQPPVQATGSNAAAVLAAWVLLSGSIAGNFYLFWSYLDVRQKYRSLVRKTARAVGSRFSAA